MSWNRYIKRGAIEATEWTIDTDMTLVSLSADDIENGNPKSGGMIARDPKNPNDRWYINPDYFNKHYRKEDE